MKRRNFFTAAGLASMLPFTAFPDNKKKKNDQQFIELIKYQLDIGSSKSAVSDFYRDVAIPVFNDLGIMTVGLFQVKYGQNEPTLYVLIPHNDIGSFVTFYDRLMTVNEFWERGKEFLNTPLSNPAYVRMEKTLLRAFSGLPAVQVYHDKLNNNSRIYEMRTYESHNLKMAKKKIDMFNIGGEIAIFQETGLNPVFFGETLAGTRMPNLTYMLVHDSMEERDKNWSKFGNHPDWKTLSQDTQYADTVSNITDLILSPLSFSQI